MLARSAGLLHRRSSLVCSSSDSFKTWNFNGLQTPLRKGSCIRLQRSSLHTNKQSNGDITHTAQKFNQICDQDSDKQEFHTSMSIRTIVCPHRQTETMPTTYVCWREWETPHLDHSWELVWNPKWVCRAWLLDRRCCLLWEVVPFAIQVGKGRKNPLSACAHTAYDGRQSPKVEASLICASPWSIGFISLSLSPPHKRFSTNLTQPVNNATAT